MNLGSSERDCFLSLFLILLKQCCLDLVHHNDHYSSYVCDDATDADHDDDDDDGGA